MQMGCKVCEAREEAGLACCARRCCVLVCLQMQYCLQKAMEMLVSREDEHCTSTPSMAARPPTGQ